MFYGFVRSQYHIKSKLFQKAYIKREVIFIFIVAMNIRSLFYVITDVLILVLNVLTDGNNDDASTCASEIKFIQSSSQYVDMKKWIGRDMDKLINGSKTMGEVCRDDESILLCEDSFSPFTRRVMEDVCESLGGRLVYLKDVTVTCNPYMNSTSRNATTYTKVENIPDCIGASCTQDELDLFMIDSDQKEDCSVNGTATFVSALNNPGPSRMEVGWSIGAIVGFIILGIFLCSCLCVCICGCVNDGGY
jgi:hypothetical protein